MPFPKVVKVRQRFPRPRVENVDGALREQLGREEIASTICPGMSVALTAGPPSPEKPFLPVPTTVVSVPSGASFRTR